MNANSGEVYKNGQRIWDISEKIMTYYYKNGRIKAQGISENSLMEGEWKFYRETGELWQVGNFKNNKKDGPWVRYARDGSTEYSEMFHDGKLAKK